MTDKEIIKRLEKENAELKAYKDVNEDFKTAWEELKAENETLKSQLDFEVQKKEVLEAENDRLKEELATYRAIGVREVCSDKANKLADKYLGCLQEIKEIAEKECKDFTLLLSSIPGTFSIFFLISESVAFNDSEITKYIDYGKRM